MQIINAYCEKLLSFEVPLEDVFFENDVHPAIKNLFDISFMSIVKSGLPINFILRTFQGTLTERFLLKDQLLTVGYFSGDEASPGAYLWLIKHFIGLVPLPLLPRQYKHRLSWNCLCSICKKLLNDPCSKTCYTFCYSISRYINGLSDANRMLFLNLLSLFECLIDESNNKLIECLASYFASSIFVRPYYPGNGLKFCRHSYYFLIFSMVHWKTLRPLCKTPHGFEIQIFKSETIRFVKMVCTSPPLLITKYYENLKVYNLGNDKAIQTYAHNTESTSSQYNVEEMNFKNSNENQLPSQTKMCNEDVITQVSGEDEYFYDEDFKDLENSCNENKSIFQIGWTCTPLPPPSPHIGWNINKSNHNLKSTKSATEKCSERSAISLQSIQSKLRSLRKIRRPSLRSIKKSNSEKDSCNIKYEKMESPRNNSY